MRISADEAKNPKTEKWVQLDRPFGPKPRLILAYLNAEALKKAPGDQCRRESHGLCPAHPTPPPPNGRKIRAFKDQLECLSAAIIRMAMATDSHAAQINSQIVAAFEFWFPKDDQQRILWPSDPAHRTAHAIWKSIKAEDQQETTVTALHKALKGKFPRIEQIKEGLAVLEERNYVKVIPPQPTGKQGRPKSAKVIVNPKFLKPAADASR